MRLYLDDDSAQHLLVQLLRKAGHDVQVPVDVGLSGKSDAMHLRHAVRGRPRGIIREFWLCAETTTHVAT